MSTRRTKDLQQALQAFSQAVEIDPDFALGWVGVADSSLLLAVMKGVSGAWENFEPAMPRPSICQSF